MPTGKARESSVMAAKRKAAVAQIAEQLRGAFGDYVRAQMGGAQIPQPIPQPVGDGTAGPVPVQPMMGQGGMPITPTADYLAPGAVVNPHAQAPLHMPFATPTLPDPGFVPPVMPQGIPPMPMPAPAPVMGGQIPPALLAYIQQMQAQPVRR